MNLLIEGGLEETEEGYNTQQKLLRIFETALLLQQKKGLTYGDAYRSQGYMGNVARVLSKVSRLKNMMWGDVEINSHDESVEDTLLDLINIAGFALMNIRDRNKWGN